MASEIRVNKIENRSGLGTVTFADTGVDLAGIVTATTFSGSGASLTSLPAAQVTGTLPAISGANLTNLAAANLTGTIADERFPATLPATSAANLTSIPAANIVGVCTAGLTKTGGFGKFVSYALLADRHTTGDRGAYTSGDWRRRDINTEVVDDDGIVTLSSNQFTLQAGNYFIKFGAVCYKVSYHSLRLQNITDDSTAGLAEADYNRQSSEVTSFTRGSTRISISGAKTFEVQGQVSETQSSNGMGFPMLYGSADFCNVEIYKEA